jgi:hypothetical protein
MRSGYLVAGPRQGTRTGGFGFPARLVPVDALGENPGRDEIFFLRILPKAVKFEKLCFLLTWSYRPDGRLQT